MQCVLVHEILGVSPVTLPGIPNQVPTNVVRMNPVFGVDVKVQGVTAPKEPDVLILRDPQLELPRMQLVLAVSIHPPSPEVRLFTKAVNTPRSMRVSKVRDA